MVGQAAAFLAAALVGSAATADRPRGNEELAAGLELAFGLGLLALACSERRGHEDRKTARAAEGLAAGEWLLANERGLTFVSTLFFGFLLTSDVLFRLL